jgi:glycine cleavage system aminomethyltransferase T
VTSPASASNGHRARNYADSHPVIRVSSKRFASSPWLDHYYVDGAVMGIYSGRLYPLSLGADPVADYWHLRREALLFDVPEHPVEVRGPDAEAFLDKIFTREMGAVPLNRARYGIACRTDGGILMDGVIIRLAEDRFWYVMADGDFLGWLHAYADGFDVTIEDPQSWVLQVQGPRSLDILRAVTGSSAPEHFPYFGVAQTQIAEQPVMVTRTGWTGELGFEIYAGPHTDHARVWEELHAVGGPLGLRLASLECMGIRRLEAGILDNGTDMDPGMTPYEAGLGRFVDLKKPSFNGREALVAADKHPRLLGLSGPETPVPGSVVRSAGERVGVVRAGAWSPTLQCGIGYVHFDRNHESSADAVTVDGASGEFHVQNLPFVDPERLLPRGLSSTPSVPVLQ